MWFHIEDTRILLFFPSKEIISLSRIAHLLIIYGNLGLGIWWKIAQRLRDKTIIIGIRQMMNEYIKKMNLII